MAGGRPTKFKSEMCDIVIAMMSDGASKAEVAAELGIARDTITDWNNNIPEFSSAIKTGEALSEAWWLKQGRINLQNKEFSATLWYMNMKNRHGWKDRQDITSNDETVNFLIKNAN